MTVRMVLDMLDEEIQSRRAALRRLAGPLPAALALEASGHHAAIRRLHRRKAAIVEACSPLVCCEEAKRCRKDEEMVA